jgi:hypothetical protein
MDGGNMNAGFYKKDGDVLLYGPNGIYTPTFSLLKENKDNYTYPVDGWYWFDDDGSAYSFFNLVKPQIEENNNVI